MIENIFKSAVAHHNKKNFSKAKEIYETLLKTNPSNFIILQNYATLLAQIKEYQKADDIFKKCLKIKPKDSLLLYNYGKFFHDQKNYDKAIKLYKESFEIEPRSAVPLYNIGNIQLSKKEFKKAIHFFEKAIKINPSNFLAYNNMAIAYKNIGNFDQALKFYKQAIDKNNNYVDGHVNYSTMLLTTNKLDEGLEQYEWRKKSKSFSDYIDYRSLNLKSKVWTGESLDNKKLFVIAEQGIGDLIQFTRYLYFIKNNYKAKIILKIKGKGFLHFFDKKDFEVISINEPIPQHDYHVHMMSLLKIFYKKNNFFCKTVNFFKRKKDIIEKWQEKLIDIKGTKIGINSTTSLNEKNIPFKHFSKLANDFNYKFIILQKDLNSNEKKEISGNKNIINFSNLDDGKHAFIDSIEVINNLDLIITADTALAHLSATLGKKTWIALPYVADWRWFLYKKDTKWYPNVTLYRQEKIEDWQGLFEIIKRNLKKEFSKVNN